MFTGATKQQMRVTRTALGPVLDSSEARRTEMRHARIARLAYYIWQVRGEQSARAEIDWLIAEHVFETGRFLSIRTGNC